MSSRIQDDYLQRFFSVVRMLSSVTRLATVVVDINGKTLSGCHNFNSFCTLVQVDERYCTNYQECDKYCAFGGLKHLKPKILSCRAGLSLFSMPLVREGHLYGFMLCGQVWAKYRGHETIIIDNKCSWMDEPKIKAEWSQMVVVDNNTLVASANLLNFVVGNFETEQRQPGEFVIPSTSYMCHCFTESSRHEEELLEMLRYIDKNLHSELSLESVAAHVCLNANYFSRFFKKRQGINFKTWMNQKRM